MGICLHLFSFLLHSVCLFCSPNIQRSMLLIYLMVDKGKDHLTSKLHFFFHFLSCTGSQQKCTVGVCKECDKETTVIKPTVIPVSKASSTWRAAAPSRHPPAEVPAGNADFLPQGVATHLNGWCRWCHVLRRDASDRHN
jgi:hypothetical protein